jgi:hypothetical protein
MENNEELDQVRSQIDEMSQEIDDVDDEINEEDDNYDEQTPETMGRLDKNYRGQGRKKGSRNKKRQKIDIESTEEDPFEFAIAYITENSDPIELRIMRGNAFLAAINYAEAQSKIKYKSLSDVQKHLGPGIYTFKIRSLSTKQLVYSKTIQILETPQIFEDETIDEKDDLSAAISALGNLKGENQNPNVHPFRNVIQMPPQPSAASTLKEWLPLITALLPLLREKKQGLSELDMYKMQMEAEKRLELKMIEERQRLKDEREEFERKVKDAVEEKAESMGLQPEKSVLGEIVEGVKYFGDMVKTRADVEKTRPQRQMPVKQRQIVQKVEPVPQVVAPVQVKIMTLDEIIDDIFVQVSNGLITTELLVPYIKTKPELMASIKHHGSDSIINQAENMLKSKYPDIDAELLAYIKGMIKPIYDSI